MSEITDLIEHSWSRNERAADILGYDLVILAVPRHPANIEAVAAIGLDLVADLLEHFVKAREVSHGLRGAAAQSSAQSGNEPVSKDGQTASSVGPDEVGQGRDVGGLSEGYGDAPAAQGEGDAAASPLAGMTDQQVDDLHAHLCGLAGIIPTEEHVDTSDIPETGEEWFEKAHVPRSYAAEVADWCARELKGAKESGSPMGRAYVQNIDMIIVALREYAKSDVPKLPTQMANQSLPGATPESERNFHALFGRRK